jgi:16S rRNA (guanine(966)-N(2))-methyltransferase RsmD
MRILAGTLARKEVVIPSNLPVRPTSSKLRKQVFDICQDRIVDTNVLDLFAGSGLMGFEAISRGARSCTFVEKNPVVVSHLRKNIALLGLPSCHVIPLDAEIALSKFAKKNTDPFSFIYIDPPYDIPSQILSRILATIDTSLPVAPGALLFLEVRKKTFSIPPLSSFSLVSSRESGDAELHLFQANP